MTKEPKSTSKTANVKRPSRSVFQLFVRNESFAGVLLLFFAILAILFANVPALAPFHNIWDIEAGLDFGSFSLRMPLLHWINDALMAIFFLNVGLEIKREMLVGELAEPKQAMLPIFAALGGMIFPAIIYTIFNHGTISENGWGIPMATDIAFAICVLTLLGKKCPLGLKVFLTALAIVDDLGSIIVLAVFYPTHALHLNYLIYAAIVFIALVIMNRVQAKHYLQYVLLGILLWYFVYKSGIHATIAGVLLAITIPAKTRINEVKFHAAASHLLNKFKESSNGQVSVLANSEQLNVLHQLNERVDAINPLMNKFQVTLAHPVNYIIMPLFALSNAGVAFTSDVFGSPFLPTIGFGVFLGLFLGKPLGIFSFSWLAVKLGIAKLPTGTLWKQLFAMGIIGGIGFTMSLFIDNLAFTDMEMVNVGKAAVLITSVVAALVGMMAVSITGRHHVAKKPAGSKE